MNNYLKDISESILAIDRYSKRAIALITDMGLCILCTWFAFVIRLDALIIFKDLNIYSTLISVVIAIPIFWLFGLYRTIFRFPGFSIIFTILASTIVYGLLYFLAVGVYGIQGVPRSIGIIQPMLLFFAIISSRLGVKYLLTRKYISKKQYNKKKVLIYGAGDAGRQLFIALENSIEFKVIGFFR